MTDKLVACKACAVVFKKMNVPTEQCPVCENKGEYRNIPKIGGVNKFWESVENE